MDKIRVEIANPTDPEVSSAIWRILQMCDHEFVPPLSSRDSTTQSNFDVPDEEDLSAPQEYFEGLKSQSLLIALLGNDIVGFMSFQHDYQCLELGDKVPSNHVTTVCIDSVARGKGVCSGFYRYMLSDLPKEQISPHISTRTWNGNGAHLRLLDKLGFTLTTKLENHRGEGIDTVYYAREVKSLARETSSRCP